MNFDSNFCSKLFIVQNCLQIAKFNDHFYQLDQ